MFRTIRLTLMLVGSLAAAVLAMRLIGATQPAPIAALFTYPDGTPCERPCLFGIEPGKTTREEAIALLKAHPLLVAVGQQTAQDDVIHIIAQGENIFTGRTLAIQITGVQNVGW